MRKYYSYQDFAQQLIGKRGLNYSPELFYELLNEVKNTPKYVELVNQTNKFLEERQTKENDNKLSFMVSYLTTDKRLK